jgi:MOB kinase activator 1
MLTIKVVDFYNQINLIYGSITEFCSPASCPEMKATDECVYVKQIKNRLEHADIERFEYLWQDNERYPRPTKMAAPEYVEHLMSWVQGNVDNEQMFPSRIGRSKLSSKFHS